MIFFLALGCGSANKLTDDTADAGMSLGEGDTGMIGSCSGTTKISGTVYDPAGRNPLYGIAVYVPKSPLKPLPSGASCGTCDDLYSGEPITSAITDATGHFVLDKTPAGENVQLVVQIGKWRRRLFVPKVTECTDNAQPDKSIRLPKNHNEGDMPNIAIATGGADSLECLLSRIGIDASEFVPGANGSGRIHVFKGGDDGGTPAANTQTPGPLAAQTLWTSKMALMPYDVVLLGCEGHETYFMNQQALYDYGQAGGRVFASHFHYSWFSSGPYGGANLASWRSGSNAIGDIKANIVTKLANNKPFPKGIALEKWLDTVGALVSGELPLTNAKHNADVSASNTASQTWILANAMSPAPGAAQYFSFDTPIGQQNKCGRVVYSDLHVGAASGDYGNQRVVPQGCAQNPLSPQEKALEFMLFDLSACVTPNDEPPKPPTPK